MNTRQDVIITMRTTIPDELENGRVLDGPYASTCMDGVFGAFILRGPCGMDLLIISSGAWKQWTWEHVSVSCKNRCPNWVEMCFVKDLFWADNEVVIQIHPAKKDYVNFHNYCLHLWMPTTEAIPLPPKIMVGPG